MAFPGDARSRRLAALWFADIVGYTSVAATDESAALRLVELFQVVVHQVVEREHGRLVKFIGDAALAEFSSTASALDAALALRNEFLFRASASQIDARLRIGLHLGDVVATADGDIYGDGVNVASRLQTAAEPGQIVVSEDVWRQLRSRKEFHFAPLGERSLRGISGRYRLFAAVASGESSQPVMSPQNPTAQNGARIRLIVLPFRLLRPDPETDFLAFSLPDAITSSLSGLRSLVVRSHLAALRFAGEMPDLRTIAAEADVDIVLTGTLLRIGEHLRVSSELTDVNDGTLLWSQSRQVSLGNLFELQDQLARRIVESLELPLTAREREILSHDVPANARAYEYYLRANQIAHEVGQWSTARDLYLESIEEDSTYAPAWARLARCYRLIAKYSEDEAAITENLELAEAAFQRSLAINPELPLAHNLYAQLEVELGRAEDAMVRLVRYACTNGGDPHLFAGLVHVCRFCGLLDASLAAHQEARRLDPGIPTSIHHTFFMRGEYERVLDNTFGDIGYIAPLALVSLGRTGEAIALLQRIEQNLGNSRVRPYLVSLRALLEGRRQESVEAIDSVMSTVRDPEALFYMVRQLAYLGETERALTESDRIVRDGFFCLPFFERDSWLDGLRPEPRFGEILARARELHRRAADAFAEAGGTTLLGLTEPI